MMKFFHLKVIGLVVSVILLLSACLTNDFPYPVVKLYITDLVVDGQKGDAVISSENRTVLVELDETVNPKKVHIKTLSVTDGATASIPSDTVVDLTNPLPVIVSLYQDYTWFITANQTIDRKFSVQGQIGQAYFYPEIKEASVLIPKDNGLDDINVTALKLGPEGSTLNGTTGVPELEWVNKGGYAEAVVHVQYSDFIDEEWKIYVSLSDVKVGIESVDAWANVAWIHGIGQEGETNGCEYKEKGTENWIRVDESDISHDGGGFTARIIHLKPQTTYICRAYSGENVSTEEEFTTEAEFQPENSSFESLSGTSPILIYGEGESMWWDTGNHGSTTMKKNVTTGDTSLKHSGNQSLLLSSQFVGIGTLGKFAAGNLFAGKYLKTDVTDGILGWGRPCTSRPTALKVWVRYVPATVEYGSEGHINKGEMDRGSIYAAIGDWSGQEYNGETWSFIVKTKSSEQSLFSTQKGTYSGDGTIAYAEKIFTEEIGSATSLVEITIPFDYDNYGGKSRKPTSIIIVASASQYGDFFAGGDSKMWIDDISLEYDYDE